MKKKRLTIGNIDRVGRTLSDAELSGVSGAKKMVLKTLFTEITYDPATQTCKNDDQADVVFGG